MAAFISIVIPTLNEALLLEETLKRINSQKFTGEIILVDAGSKDQTVEIAQRKGCLVFQRGVAHRAAQMNYGASMAKGTVLLFLHADTLLPDGGLALLSRTLEQNPVCVGGAFKRRFAGAGPFLQATAYLTDLRNHTVGWHLGDQGIFVRKKIFEELGGFKEISPFEDLDFSRRMKRAGPVVTLALPVLSSRRRFQKDGELIRTLKDLYLTLCYCITKRS